MNDDENQDRPEALGDLPPLRELQRVHRRPEALSDEHEVDSRRPQMI
jgi:hypothetical protein